MSFSGSGCPSDLNPSDLALETKLKWRHKILAGTSTPVVWPVMWIVMASHVDLHAYCMLDIFFPWIRLVWRKYLCIQSLHLRWQLCEDMSRASKQVVDEQIRDSLHFPPAAARQQLADMEEISAKWHCLNNFLPPLGWPETGILEILQKGNAVKNMINMLFLLWHFCSWSCKIDDPVTMQRNMILCFECFCCQSPKRVFNTVRLFVFPCTWIDVFVGATYFYCRFSRKGIVWRRHGFWDFNIHFRYVLMTFDENMSLIEWWWLTVVFGSIICPNRRTTEHEHD